MTHKAHLKRLKNCHVQPQNKYYMLTFFNKSEQCNTQLFLKKRHMNAEYMLTVRLRYKGLSSHAGIKTGKNVKMGDEFCIVGASNWVKMDGFFCKITFQKRNYSQYYCWGIPCFGTRDQNVEKRLIENAAFGFKI